MRRKTHSLTHYSALDDVDRRPQADSEEAGTQSRQDMCHNVVFEESTGEQRLLDLIVAGQLGSIDDGVSGDVGTQALPQSPDSFLPGNQD